MTCIATILFWFLLMPLCPFCILLSAAGSKTNMGVFSSHISLLSTDETTPEHWAPQCSRDETTEKVQQSSTKTGGGEHLSPARKSWGVWKCLPWDFSATGWFHQCTWREGAKRAEPGSAWWCSVMGSGQWVQTETVNSLGTSGNVFYTASFPLVHIVQGDYGVSPLWSYTKAFWT